MLRSSWRCDDGATPATAGRLPVAVAPPKLQNELVVNAVLVAQEVEVSQEGRRPQARGTSAPRGQEPQERRHRQQENNKVTLRTAQAAAPWVTTEAARVLGLIEAAAEDAAALPAGVVPNKHFGNSWKTEVELGRMPKEALSAELLAEGQSAEELEQNELLVDAVLKAQEWRYLKKDTSPASTTAEWRCFLGAGGTALCLNTPG